MKKYLTELEMNNLASIHCNFENNNEFNEFLKLNNYIEIFIEELQENIYVVVI